MERKLGQTQAVGFQFGIRKTFSRPKEEMVKFMFSESGLKIWLGELDDDLEINKSFRTQNGIEGFIRVFVPGSHIRLNWKKKDWENNSTLQLRIIENGKKTTISIHQEKLLDTKQREEMKKYWNEIMGNLTDTILNLKEQRLN